MMQTRHATIKEKAIINFALFLIALFPVEFVARFSFYFLARLANGWLKQRYCELESAGQMRPWLESFTLYGRMLKCSTDRKKIVVPK